MNLLTGGSLECVRFILSMGAEVDAIDIKGQTPLFLASSLGYPATMEVGRQLFYLIEIKLLEFRL